MDDMRELLIRQAEIKAARYNQLAAGLLPSDGRMVLRAMAEAETDVAVILKRER